MGETELEYKSGELVEKFTGDPEYQWVTSYRNGKITDYWNAGRGTHYSNRYYKGSLTTKDCKDWKDYDTVRTDKRLIMEIYKIVTLMLIDGVKNGTEIRRYKKGDNLYLHHINWKNGLRSGPQIKFIEDQGCQKTEINELQCFRPYKYKLWKKGVRTDIEGRVKK